MEKKGRYVEKIEEFIDIRRRTEEAIPSLIELLLQLFHRRRHSEKMRNPLQKLMKK